MWGTDATATYDGGEDRISRRTRSLDVRTPGTASLRKDGIAAFLSGAGQGGPAKVTVKSSDAPWVVVVRTTAL